MTTTPNLEELINRAIDDARDDHEDQQIVSNAAITWFHDDVAKNLLLNGVSVSTDAQWQPSGLSVVSVVKKKGRTRKTGFCFWVCLKMDGAQTFEDDRGRRGYTFEELRRTKTQIVGGAERAEAWAKEVNDHLRAKRLEVR